ncbi:MAG: trimethylamine methyltransferase family protein [Anaerolineales bacterium]|nr:trimethylamine methyltransferase family protein [Anaerolineales bacterium]
MRTLLQVLSAEEQAQVHERSLSLLDRVGLRVETARGRAILGQAGAHVDEQEQRVHFPRALIEEALRLAPRKFKLGGRRPGYEIALNANDCTLLADGGALFVYDAELGIRRLATHADWVKATHLIDALDEIGLYWWMVRDSQQSLSPADTTSYWRDVLTHTSKHVQDVAEDPSQASWILEILQVVFGERRKIRRLHPISFLVCPFSPLTIEGPYTDAYLEMVGWDIPLAVMPMPLMGITAPGRLISTIMQGNCEVLGFLCLQQAAEPGAPFIYAPALAVAEPRSGRYGSGAVEHSLLGAAATEMARFYGFPVEASTGGSDHHIPSIQAGYERALNWVLPALSWPDILVGPGLLSGSTMLSFEQLIIDVEIFQRCRRLHKGIESIEEFWLEDIIERVGPGGNFLAQRSTRDALRSGEWHLGNLGVHGTYEAWESAQVDTLVEARARIDEILAHHSPLPLDMQVQRELDQIVLRSQQEDQR